MGKPTGWLMVVNEISGWWFHGWIIFHNSYMGCHPPTIDSYFSRWLWHHQPENGVFFQFSRLPLKNWGELIYLGWTTRDRRHCNLLVWQNQVRWKEKHECTCTMCLVFLIPKSRSGNVSIVDIQKAWLSIWGTRSGFYTF